MNSPATAPPPEWSAPKKGARIFWPHIVLGLIGLALSFYAVYAHLQIEAGQATGCSINDTISCDDVIGSPYGKFAGIPLGYFGAAFWIIVIISGISSAATSLRNARLQALGVAVVGLVTSVVLAYIAHFVLGKICPICSGTHGTALVNFVYATVAWFKMPRINESAPRC